MTFAVFGCARDDHVAVTDGFDFFEAAAFNEHVKRAENGVQHFDQATCLHGARQLGEADKVCEEDGDAGMRVGDEFFPAFETVHDGARENVVKEFVGLLLFGDDHVVFLADAGEMFFFEVAQAFAFDGGGDAGAEEDGIERFWEVILGAHFNAADGIAGVLAAGDDDDGRGGLGMFSDFVEHLESVDLWHFDVE